MPNENAPRNDALAPRWHTALLVAFLVVVPLVGLLLQSHSVDVRAQQTSTSSLLAGLYLPTIVVQWSFVAYVARIGRRSNALRGLLGRPFAPSDLPIAAALALVIIAMETAWQHVASTHLGVARATASPSELVPVTPVERAAFVVVVLSVAFSEELVYRGYLRTQLAALCRCPARWSPTVGVVLQALLFGLAHTSQGMAFAIRSALYGAVFGIVAWQRRGLAACIFAHATIDLAAGLQR